MKPILTPPRLTSSESPGLSYFFIEAFSQGCVSLGRVHSSKGSIPKNVTNCGKVRNFLDPPPTLERNWEQAGAEMRQAQY